MMNTIPDLPIHVIHEKLKGGEISISEVLRAVLDRIEAVEERINAFIQLDEERARARAVELEEKLPQDPHPLYGIPMAIKDNIVVGGFETTCGSRILLGYRPPYTATAVSRLLEKGVIILGKTNLDEFGMGASGEYSYFGSTSNPWNTEYVPGGSSSGSAASVAAGEAIACLGTDTGGSVRQPGAFTGTVGFKPTYGRVSRYGLVAFASSLDQIGMITKDVRDAGILFSVIAGFDPLDSTSFDLEVPALLDLFSGYERERFKVGLPKEYFVGEVHPEIKDAVTGVAERLERSGFPVKEVSLPHTKYSVAVYHLIATAEASSNLARYDGVRYGHNHPSPDLEEMYRSTRTEGFGEEVKRRILLGTFALSSGYYEAYYLKAQKARRLIREDFDNAFKEVDVVLTPVSPVLPFKKGERIRDPFTLYLIDIFTVTANLAGLPAMTLPITLSKEGLPIGFQLIGRPFDEATLLKIARFYEENLSEFDLKRVKTALGV